jgi:hypothetical protein
VVICSGLTVFTGLIGVRTEEETSKMLQLEHLYGAETCTLRAVDQKHLGSFEMCCWRIMEKIRWTYHVRNEEVLLRVKEQIFIFEQCSPVVFINNHKYKCICGYIV